MNSLRCTESLPEAGMIADRIKLHSRRHEVLAGDDEEEYGPQNEIIRYDDEAMREKKRRWRYNVAILVWQPGRQSANCR